MSSYVAFDVSLRSTSVHVVDETGKFLWRGKCATEPDVLATVVRKHAPGAVRVGLETGFVSTWLYHALIEAGLPIVCMDARQARAVLQVRPNKTDANDAEGLAQLLRTGFYREVRVKSWDSMLLRNLITARRQLVCTEVDLANQLRAILRTFGLALPPGGGGGRHFEAAVRERASIRPGLSLIVLPLLEAWRAVRDQVGVASKAVVAAARRDRRCRLLMTAPGVGAITALTYVGTVEDPKLFHGARRVGAWLGLTPSRYQSGETDISGRISRCGDALLRTYLYEAAHQVLTRSRSDSALKRWGLGLKARNGHKKAVVAVARKLAVILHAMWSSGEAFCAEPALAKAA
jgi:transposase